MKSHHPITKSALISAIWIMLSAPSWAGETATEKEKSELDAAQSESSQALQNYYQAIKSGQTPQAATEKHLSAAQNKLTQITTSRHQANQAQIFNRVYFPDGTSISKKTYDEDPAKFQGKTSAGPAAETGAKTIAPARAQALPSAEPDQITDSSSGKTGGVGPELFFPGKAKKPKGQPTLNTKLAPSI